METKAQRAKNMSIVQMEAVELFPLLVEKVMAVPELKMQKRYTNEKVDAWR